MEIKIGDIFLIPQDDYWRRKGQPWKKVTVKGETSRSWIVGIPEYEYADIKVPKKNPETILYTEQTAKEADWLHEHAWKIRDMVRNLSYEKMKKISEIVGYEAAIKKAGEQ